MKYVATIIAVICQVAILAYMAGEREYILRSGTEVQLRVLPIDPRDVMRGDYVRLNYNISNIDRDICKGILAKGNSKASDLPRDTKIYVALEVNDAGIAKAVTASLEQPEDTLFIRGRLNRAYNTRIRLRYGIEAYFMEQEKAKQLELGTLARIDGFRIPLKIKIAIGHNGVAVIKGHKLSPIGVRTRLIQGDRLSAQICLKNTSDNNVAIVDVPNGKSFALLCDRQRNPKYKWVNADTEPPTPAPEDVVVIEPGREHPITINLNDPYWYVIDLSDSDDSATLSPIPLSQIDNPFSARFRFEYRPPPPADLESLPNSDIIFAQEFTTGAFRVDGRID
ncbi:MAG: GDYXXLXY domain-containing protein [Verrucomicrobia bacterium]|nr:GDYXXLXY domain-containing protein [Verrucomicrobiota bacterium]